MLKLISKHESRSCPSSAGPVALREANWWITDTLIIRLQSVNNSFTYLFFNVPVAIIDIS